MSEEATAPKVTPANVTMVRWDRKMVTVEWDSPNGDGRIDHLSFESNDAPLSEFEKAFEAMSKHAAELIEDTTWAETLQVRKVKIDRDKKRRATLVMSALRELELHNSPLNVNIPKFKERDDEEANVGTFSTECLDAMNTLCEEAARYVEGWREKAPETGDLFDGADDDNPLDEEAA